MTRARLLLIASLLSLPSAADAQCDGEMTVLGCYEAMRKAPAVKQATRETEQKPTGDQQATGTATSIHDFLPKAAGAVMVPGLAEDFGGLSFNRNFTLDTEYTLYIPIAVQAGAALRKPQVFQAIIDTLPEDRRPIVKERLEKELDEFDDPELSVALTLETRRFGRRLEKHREELGNVTPPRATNFTNALNALQIAVGAASPTCTGDNGLAMKMNCYNEAEQESLVQAIEELIAAETDYADKLKQWQEQSGWSQLSDLINNKPQLTLRAAWFPADPAIGPETMQLTAKYEIGFANINATRRYCRRNGGYTDGKFTDTCFRQHVLSNTSRTMLALGWRLFFQFDAKFDNAYEAPYVTDDNASFSTPSSTNYTFSGGLGGNIPGSGAVQSARIDLAVGYVSAQADGARTDERTWVSLTHTQRLWDKVALLSGLEWSDKAEFKHEPTSKLRAKFGIRYKLITDE
jgi:hypothetical protein